MRELDKAPEPTSGAADAECFPALAPGLIHVWCIQVEQAHLDAAMKFLSAKEQERLLKLRVQHDQCNFAVTRAVLKQLLIRYLGVDSGDLNISLGENGKPYVVSEADIQFNVSHSRDAAMIAFALQRSVGIDLEWMDPTVDIEGITERFFLTDERRELFSVPQEERVKVFYRMWTCKESKIKASAKTLGSLISVSGSLAEFGELRAYDLQAPDGYAAALSEVCMANDAATELKMYRWQTDS